MALIGVILTSIGIGSAGSAGHFDFLLFVILVIFTMGQLLIMPSIDAVVAEYAPAGLTQVIRAFPVWPQMLGGIIGNILGGILYNWARNHDRLSQVWDVYFMLGILICTLYFFFHRVVHKGVE